MAKSPSLLKAKLNHGQRRMKKKIRAMKRGRMK